MQLSFSARTARQEGPGTFAYVRIGAKMGFVPSRGSTHDHAVDLDCPSKQQKI
jgi:hypothetical protein